MRVRNVDHLRRASRAPYFVAMEHCAPHDVGPVSTARNAPAERHDARERLRSAETGRYVAREPGYRPPDRRSKHGRLLAEVRENLIRHIGGEPSFVESLLVDRCSWMVAHLNAMDQKALRSGGMSAHASREYLAWTNTLRRLLAQLGMKPAPGRDHDDLAALLDGGA